MKKLLLIALAFVAYHANAQMTLKAISQNPMCYGSATGSLALTIDGGTAPYIYQWSNGATTPSITNLTAGTYSVTVGDNAGLYRVASILLTEPSQITMTAFVVDASTNGGTDGGINIAPRGGIVNYSYLWSNGATSEDIGGLAAGTYTVSLTDGVGCTATLSRTVNQPPSQMVNPGMHQNSSQSNSNNNNNGLIAPNAGSGQHLSISAYPNPASNFLKVSLKEPMDAEVTLFDMNGKVVSAQKFSNYEPKVDVSDLPNGNYIIRVVTAGETVNQNIVIAK